MSNVEESEAAVRRLSPQERAAFRTWFVRFEADEWDRRLESDVAAGKSDWPAAAPADQQAGRLTER